ncbi:MAG: hypothetical protein LBE18_10045 [Planctomycetaceae bacterium]|jgi:flagellin|nr:hypothetical protein [Planctomycetaceae bacterium]
MAIYFNTNLPETRGLLAFDRTTNTINTILERLDTGYRINSGKDDPTGLIKREGLRLEMKGLQAAINNSIAGQSLLSVAEQAMGSIASLLTGDPTDAQDTGIVGLLNSNTTDANQISNGINQLADTIDAISRTTIYNGKQIINGAYNYNTTATKVTGTGGMISNINVTSANTPTDNTPLTLDLKISQVAQQAGVEIKDDIDVQANDTYTITLTDSDGQSVNVKLENNSGTNKTYPVLDVYNAIQAALTANSNVDLETKVDSSKYYLSTKSKGADQNMTIVVTDKSGNGVNLSTSPFVANGSLDTSKATSGILTATGQDWQINGIEGTVVTDDNKINVYSNTASFSASFNDDTAANDTFTINIMGGTSFQLGKDINSGSKYNFGIAAINSSNLVAKDGTTLNDLRSLDYDKDENIVKAQKAIEDFASQIATERGRLGTIQKNVLGTNQTNLEDQLAIVTETEATISNTDVALETSRLARQELIADSAMSVIQYARAFSQFAVSSLFQ